MFTWKGNKLIIQVNDRNKVVLKPREIFLLRQLMIHGVMQSRSIYDFLKAASSEPLKSNVINNRLKRLIDTKIINVSKEKLTDKWNTNTRYHYTLGDWGVGILVFSKYISIEKGEKILKESRQRTFPKPNEATASILANEILIKFLFDERNNANDFSHQQAFSHPWIKEMGWFDGKIKNWPYSPDWIFESDAIFVCLITNTNISSAQQMDSVVERYVTLAKIAKSGGKKFNLVFTMIDESIRILPDDKIKNVNRKIAHLKQIVSPLQYWVADMGIYILPAKRTVQLITGLIEPEISQYNNSNDFPHIFFPNIDLYRFKFNILQKNHPLYKLKDGVIKADEVVRLKLKDDERYIAIITGIEGSVVTYERARGMIQRLSKLQNTNISLWIVYPEAEHASFDILNLTPLIRVWATDYETWQMEARQEGHFPKMLSIGKNHRKSRQAYYESLKGRFSDD